MTIPQRTPKRAPDLRKYVALSTANKAQSSYYNVPFAVPEGVTRLEVHYRYAKSEECVLDLGLGDPRLSDFPSQAGLRGWSGGARTSCFVARDAATPGYVAGEIQSGEWSVILGLYRVTDTPVEVEIEIWFSYESRALLQATPPAQPARAQAGWYCGDLQCHTFHSDAFGSPQQLHATAIREGLDFLAVTDHNTVTQQQGYFDGASTPDLVFIPAYEFTTEFGHANLFGVRLVFDFRAENDADVLSMAQRARAAGALLSINHDKPPIPWQWALPDIDCMEVWQSHWLAGNQFSLEKYQERLRQGMRITAIGSSDFHQPAVEPANNPLTLARPTTFLWLEELSEREILRALRLGRSFVSESPTGPLLIIASGSATQHGDSLPSGPMDLEVSVTGAVGDSVQIWDGTGLIAEIDVDSDAFRAKIPLAKAEAFVRAELIAVRSRQAIIDDLLSFVGGNAAIDPHWGDPMVHPIRRALTSPIYIDPVTSP